ncbi:alpha/beta fold hydrolase [Mesorhizobium sp. BAC0120]|uniref:alpha/beta fold hydrolase n=1 Tax=Mesorhizobium sp. BAC0120 TaxID=3090670 RepID=UPI00298BD817|nr:alpha/beta fold hydrolase [Mesorhizobium sp. BAC0120]MDW6023705.1 alpha/beta fold hydrolase [Mesorhizobium sp. BAC0120]
MFEPFRVALNMAPVARKVIWALFGAAEHVMPAAAGRIAFELFARTPHPKSLGEGGRKAVERAAGLLAEARRHCLTTRSGRITVFEFRPRSDRGRRAPILVLHGWGSRTEFMKGLIEGFRDAGHRVISLDFPGHGHSPGRRLTLVSAVESVRVAGEWFGPFEAIVGHSFGGAVAVNAVAGSVKGVPPLAADRLVLIAAPSSMPALFEGFGRQINLGKKSYRSFAARVERLAGHPLEHYVGSARLAEAAVPTLVLHAHDDREVSIDHPQDYAAAGDHVRLDWVDGLGHRRVLGDPRVVNRAVAFLSEGEQTALVY